MSRRLALAPPADRDADADALDALARALAPRVAALLGAQREGAALVDVLREVPAPRRALLRACRSGAIAGAVKVARHWLAPRAAIDAWLRTQGPRAVAAPSKGDGDGLDAMRERLARGRRR